MFEQVFPGLRLQLDRPQERRGQVLCAAAANNLRYFFGQLVNFFHSQNTPIEILDAGSRGAGQGSRNHVIFDDATIDIIRRYGIAGLIGGGAAATAAGGQKDNTQ
jgi:hypothetical protein